MFEQCTTNIILGGTIFTIVMTRKPTVLNQQIVFKYVAMALAGIGHKHFSSETVQLPVLHLWYNKGQLGV